LKNDWVAVFVLIWLIRKASQLNFPLEIVLVKNCCRMMMPVIVHFRFATLKIVYAKAQKFSEEHKKVKLIV